MGYIILYFSKKQIIFIVFNPIKIYFYLLNIFIDSILWQENIKPVDFAEVIYIEISTIILQKDISARVVPIPAFLKSN